MKKSYDVIVVGAGHAGIEAALVASRMGMKTALLTNNIERIGYMSCNPSIGGLGKGHMVKEIDILGGEMGRAADFSCIQYKRLNASKGPAVRGSRIQCDKDLYSQHMYNAVSRSPNIDVLALEAQKLIIHNNICRGIISTSGDEVTGQTVVISTGTFMNAVMHFGLTKITGGRVGDKATIGLSDQFKDLGFKILRLKTGTPARAHKDSIDWSKTKPQSGDKRFIPFSLRSFRELRLPQIDCYMTYTNEKTHEIIRNNLDKSPMFSGVIEGVGPRYCPSIEDKVTRFADKDRHQSFLEPEGLNCNSIYIQGLSTSLPEEVQYKFLRTIAGLENVQLIRPGYAVEYDCVEPTQLRHTLETKSIANLYLAGQINGTSGYEEAAAQGLVAGANASQRVMQRSPFILRRDQAYIGVLIDDLVTKGTREPYRMMTSRAEHRLVLREDNAIDRLAGQAEEFCFVSSDLLRDYNQILDSKNELRNTLRKKVLVPNEVTQESLRSIGSKELAKPVTLEDLLRREDISCSSLAEFGFNFLYDQMNVIEPVEIEIKYSGYITRQQTYIEQVKRYEDTKIPADIDYNTVYGLSREEIEKLSNIQPISLAQASRVSGVNPSAIQALLVHIIGRQRHIVTKGGIDERPGR
ncbi:MAG: tRNA uridine-5-carboxymethylaminomethyl(34) synthesis enzyme MnmG [Bdellovibrionales bacterium RBG_16_40_8]|nr:MAG: tRNA uridine-5-carboxymethylaminomethyl(34) synthesis enzyme MnmG [Bdellovibrionales bacterium RBG_16_40_8]